MKGLARETTCEAHPFQGGGGGGVTPIGAVSRAATGGQDAVKWSRHFLGVGQTVKQCAGALLVSWTRPLPPQNWMYCVLVMQYSQRCGGSGLVLETRAPSAVLLAIKRRGRSFVHAQLSMVKGQSGVVKRLRPFFDGQKS